MIQGKGISKIVAKLINIFRPSFNGEDFKNVANITLRGDWATVLDIGSAYNHIKVSEELQKYPTFTFAKQTYAYVDMSFEGIRMMVYFDDILILAQNPNQLILQTQRAKQLLESLGWIISPESMLNPQQQVQYIGWIWNLTNLTVVMPEDRRKKMIGHLFKQNKQSQRRYTVKIRNLARLIARAHQGWNGVVQLTPKLKKDLSWQLSKERKNKPQTFEVISPQALIVIDVSRRGCEATLLLNSNNIEFKSGGIWKKSWILKSSNQRELAAGFCAVRRFEKQLMQEQIHSVHLQTDNTTTSYNVNRANSSRTLAHLADAILQTMEQINIQIRSTYIPGAANKTADSLSRLNRAGDYSLGRKPASGACMMMKFKPTIDLFVSRKNRLTKEYCTFNQDKKAAARNTFSISWAREQPIIHSPIPLISRCLKRVIQERIQALIIISKLEGQYQQPLPQQMTVRSLNLGQTDQILKNGTISNRRGWESPPGELLASLISGKKEENKEKTCSEKQ
ncbi:MAG: putative reverse transcriptase [Streblomastix strix]|uniref:Putative reverse transcriptase n=1 Tax=Streblomastix strix TaxID=222440 RepID=A0A5J4VUZ9_9EUKA|nr:MAG: putative reverse transcriptase [Streblomastix strix]